MSGSIPSPESSDFSCCPRLLSVPCGRLSLPAPPHPRPGITARQTLTCIPHSNHPPVLFAWRLTNDYYCPPSLSPRLRPYISHAGKQHKTANDSSQQITDSVEPCPSPPFPVPVRLWSPRSLVAPPSFCLIVSSRPTTTHRRRNFFLIEPRLLSIDIDIDTDTDTDTPLSATPRPATGQAITYREHGFVVVKRCRCALPRGEEDRRRLLWRHLRGNQSVEQPTSGHQIRELFADKAPCCASGCPSHCRPLTIAFRNPVKATLLNSEMSIGHTRSSSDAVSSTSVDLVVNHVCIL